MQALKPAPQGLAAFVLLLPMAPGADEHLRQSSTETIAFRQNGVLQIEVQIEMLRGKSNVDLRYNIKVPRKTNLRIRHDIGEVRIDRMK